MKRVLEALLIVALMAVVFIPKSVDARHRSKSVTITKSYNSGYSTVCVPPAAFYSAAVVSAAPRMYYSAPRYSACPNCPNGMCPAAGYRVQSRVQSYRYSSPPVAAPVKSYQKTKTFNETRYRR